MKTKTVRLLRAAEISIPKHEPTCDMLRLANADLFDGTMTKRDDKATEMIARAAARLIRWLEVE